MNEAFYLRNRTAVIKFTSEPDLTRTISSMSTFFTCEVYDSVKIPFSILMFVRSKSAKILKSCVVPA